MGKSKCLKTLRRRTEYLATRIEEAVKNGKNPHFDKRELAALNWAIEFIEERSPILTGQREEYARD